jgi:hypothetical protein
MILGILVFWSLIITIVLAYGFNEVKDKKDEKDKTKDE